MLKQLLVILFFVTNTMIGKAIDQPKVDSLLNLLEHTDKDTLTFDYNYSIALQYIKVNPLSSLKYINNGLNAIDKNSYPDRYLDGLNLKAACFWFNNNMDSALLVYYESLSLSENKNNSDLIAKISNNIGVTYQYIGNNDSAEKYLIKACLIYDSIGNKKAYAKASLDLGGLYTKMSKYELAIDKLLDGLSTFEYINDTVYLIHGYNSIGNLYLNINEAKLALGFYQKSLKLCTMFDKADISDELYCNMGLTYLQGLNNNDSAEYYFLKALSKEGIKSNRLLYSTTLVNLATLKDNQGKYYEALEYFSIVESLDVSESDPYSRMACCINMGNTYLKIGQLDNAIKYITEGLNKAISLNNLEFQKNAYLYLSRADSILGNYSKSIQHYQNYHKISLKMGNSEIEEKIQIIKSKQELEQIQTENKHLAQQNELKQDLISKHIRLNILSIFALSLTIVILVFTLFMYRKTKKLNISLHNKNNEINRQKEELQTLNSQLNKLISIIAHDLKSPFNALIGLLNELDINSSQYTEDEKHAIIKGLLKNTRSTYYLLENLMNWSVSKTGLLNINIEKINLSKLTNEVLQLNQIQLENKLLIVKNTLSPHIEAYADHKMTFTILTNLISNAIKFTRPGGTISIKSELTEDYLKISVSDNGIGIPEKHIDDIFSIDSDYQTRGTENEYGTGLGLKVVAEFIHRMNGKVSITSVLGESTTITFDLPLKN